MKDEIKRLQNELISIYQADKDCGPVLEDSEIIAAYETAIESLKRKSEAETYRTPMKVDRYPEGYVLCPRCGNLITHLMTPYCEDCGQAFDWSEVEE